MRSNRSAYTLGGAVSHSSKQEQNLDRHVDLYLCYVSLRMTPACQNMP